MKKYKRLIKSMTLSIVLSCLVIVILQFKFKNCIYSSTISNIFMGILGSSIIALVGYLFEYFSLIKQNRSELIEYYREVRIRLIPFIEKLDTNAINNIMHEKIIFNLRSILEDYKRHIQFYNKISNIKFIKKNDIDIWELGIIPKYIKVIYVLSEIHDYFTCMNSSIFARDFLLNEYREMYRFMKSYGVDLNTIKNTLKPTENRFKNYINYEMKMRERIISLNLKQKCKSLDILLGIFVLNIK